MLSLIGQHFPMLFALVVGIFSVTLLSVSISENRAAYRAAKRKQAADREAPDSVKARSR